MQAWAMLATPVLLALLAVGAVLFIKITRRRQATELHAFGGAVPARPLSAGDAQRMKHRYVIAAVAVATLLVLLALIAGGSAR